jgi:hypothetical protein
MAVKPGTATLLSLNARLFGDPRISSAEIPNGLNFFALAAVYCMMSLHSAESLE